MTSILIIGLFVFFAINIPISFSMILTSVIYLILKGDMYSEKSKEIRDFHDEIHREILLEIDAEERKEVISKLDTLRMTMEAVKGKLV